MKINLYINNLYMCYVSLLHTYLTINRAHSLSNKKTVHVHCIRQGLRGQKDSAVNQKGSRP